MMYYKYYGILQKYDKLNTLSKNASNLLNLKFENENENSTCLPICISLSGGVDSMVLLDLLLRANKRIIAIHVNYNNRDESKLEEEFLRGYCEARSIEFICHSFDFKRGSINRNIYENLTKKIKFGVYKSILQKYNAENILLAHHKDDIIENIFTNFCRGDNFLNLSVIKEYSTILGVNIHRPLLNFYKDDIYDYAHYYEVPYFLDTTPDWSVRGKFRRRILPELFNTFPGLKSNLLGIAKESEEWGSLIQSDFIDKYLNKVSAYDNYIEMPIIYGEDYSTFPVCFWQEIISRVFHRYSLNAPSRKSLNVFVEYLKNKQSNQILLKYNTKINIDILNNVIKITFSEN